MIVYLSLGSNLGNREQTIDKTIQLLSEQVGPLIKRSSFFYSKPWGFDSPNDFCNICASFKTELSPIDLLHTTQSIERQLGRTKKSNFKQQSGLTSNSEAVYSDRPIDIDIIRVFDDDGTEIKCQISNDKSKMSNDKCQMTNDKNTVQLLSLPHPLWQQRDFVKVPLEEIMQ
ncbi:MAG: 2-amino-4-hydroxy-6-hydroxymethyldihydropteridine diphosphokinase [Paludibacteraceae bacterium]|nr:2-amino-4-hydroxy-6-hydroxymethyldihydropteridine diphosphokinase [Paludibacteraceae bacterium]